MDNGNQDVFYDRIYDDTPYHLINKVKDIDEGKKELLIDSLEQRVKEDNIEEVILATSATVEGQTTAFYIQNSLKDSNVKVSKLAQGLPVGGEIENLDDGTLIYAFKNRHGINKN